MRKIACAVVVLLSLFFSFAINGDSGAQNNQPAFTEAEIDIKIEAKRAARRGNLSTLKKLVRKHEFILESEQIVYELFADALVRDHFAIADYLLPYIKDYNFVTEYGHTYIMIAAAQEKNLKYLEHFLKKSELIDHKAKDGSTAFSSAAAGYNLKAMKVLIEHGAKDLDSHSGNNAVPLNVAVAHGDAELVEMMLKRGADPNHQYETFYRQFPLQIATEKGFPEITELLLKYKANPNKLTCYGETPLYLAKRRADREHFRDEDKVRDEKVVAVLRRHGARMPENKPASRESVGGFRRPGC